MRPPGVEIDYDDNLPLTKARLISYEQIRSIEDIK